MAKHKTKRARISLADKARLGPEVAAIKARTPRKEWAQIVKDAHKRGFTVAGVLSGVPDPLKERTRSSLVAEAQQTVNSAFKPAEQELSYQEAKVRALDDKRKADEAHFQEWLANQHQNLATQAATADAEMVRRQQEIQDQTRQSYATSGQQAQQNAAAQPGTVSDPAHSTALDLSADAQRANELVANQRQASASMSDNAKGYAIAGRGVSLALSQQANATRASETAAALSDIAAGRRDLGTKRAAAAAEEIRRLFGVEIDKADSNRNYLAAAQQLGLKQDQMALDAQSQANNERYRDRKLQQDAAIANARNQVDLYRIQSSAQQKAADRALREKLKLSGTAVSGADITRSSKASARLAKIASDIATVRAGKKTKRPLRQIITGRGASSLEYELALDIAVHGKLSPVNRRRAAKLGILNPEDL